MAEEALMPWFLIVGTGLVGAIADVLVSYWSQTHKFQWWLTSGIVYLVFMTGLGLIVRQGIDNGYTLTVALVLVVLVNVALVAAWDIYIGTSFSVLQWVGITLAVGAVVCLELGRS